MEENKVEKKNNALVVWIVGLGLAGSYLLGFKAGQNKLIKDFRKNCRRVDFGIGIDLPLFYHKDSEKTVGMFFRIIENELEELDKLREGTK